MTHLEKITLRGYKSVRNLNEFRLNSGAPPVATAMRASHSGLDRHCFRLATCGITYPPALGDPNHSACPAMKSAPICHATQASR